MNRKIEKILGWILLTPPVGFIIAAGSYNDLRDLGSLPVYFGLIAIAGAYLIKEKS